MESQQIVDKETGMLRPVRYQDIVILTRSPAGWTDTVTRILQDEGIPVLAESADGYFETLEIGWMMDYLRVLDNFRQDIPLVAVLKSPFGKMTNEELAQIRELNAEVPFYQNVLETADPEKKTDLPAGILKKVRDVFGWLFYFRELDTGNTAIHDPSVGDRGKRQDTGKYDRSNARRKRKTRESGYADHQGKGI